MKTCTKCGEIKDVSEYWRQPKGAKGLTASCKSCLRIYRAKWCEANPEKMRLRIEKKRLASRKESCDIKRDRRLKHHYGIDQEYWEALFRKQNGCCAICARHQRALTRVLQVDHNHETGQIRGLLCTKCNTKLAAVEEREFVDRAHSYLAHHSIRLVESK